jgi:phospholipid/cholesterol/gamma-HCH transport system permease protein
VELEQEERQERVSFSVEPKDEVIHLKGRLRMQDAPAIWTEVREATERAPKGKRALTIDLSEATAIDGGVMSLLVALRTDLYARGVKAEIEGTPTQFEGLVDLYEAKKPPRKRKKRKPEGIVEHIGRATIDVAAEVKGVVSFFGEMVVAVVGLVRHPKSGHWKEIPPLMNKAGADALPIVILINFLVGFVMAYQSARQLKMFGANIYVADLVGLSVTRELCPLMTAIIICGRSGAAFTAEIGSMKVSEEIDALRTLGLRPFSWLVVPRVIALMLIAPMLTIIADLIAVIGGLFVAMWSLDLSANGYFIETKKAMEFWDVESGLVKCAAFSLAIGLIACQQGFATSGGAEGVGRRTTSTVVTSLFAIVILDALFTIIFRVFDL